MSDPLWNYVKLLMHADGIDGSLRFCDERHNVFPASGNAKVSTLQKKLGAASLAFDGTGDYTLSFTSSASWAINAGTDFAIEFFAFPRDTANASPVAFLVGSGGAVGSSNVWIGYDWATAAGKWAFFNGSTSSTTPVLVSTSNVVYDQWVHIAVTRSGNTVRLFVNGVIEATATISGALTNTSPLVLISGSSPANNYYGYLDEIRYTVGAARYTANFTPPTAAFEHGDQVFDPDYDKVVFHSHFDEKNTVGAVSDNKGHSISIISPATLATSNSKFGGNSLSFPNTASARAESTSSDYLLGSGDFTIEGWASYSAATFAPIFSFENAAGGGVGLGLVVDSSSTNRVQLTVNGSVVANMLPLPSGGLSNFFHFALTRSGSTIRLFINGSHDSINGVYNIGSTSISQNGRLVIGQSISAGAFSQRYIDEMRITKGLARYTLPFSAPSEPFPDYMPQRLTGTVRDSAGNPIARTVRSYRSSDGLLVSTGVSDGVTGAFSLRATDLSEHFVVVHDPVKNALVYDHITPVL